MVGTLIPILGDQLSPDISSLSDADPADTVVLMMEVAEETGYVRHHKAKLAYVLSAMRHHADRLRDLGWRVDYIRLDDPDNSGSFTGEVARAVERHSPDRIIVTEAGEWRVAAMLGAWDTRFEAEVDIRPDTRFLASHAEFDEWAEGRKQLRMEFFYREMRRKTGLLMDGDKPAGGEWNYDKQNRKAPPSGTLDMPRPIRFQPDDITREVLDLVAARFADHPGSLDHFHFAVSHEEAMRQKRNFLDHALPCFGDYQDAMLTGEPFLWHSLLSPYLNSGLLDPLDLCRDVAERYAQGKVPLNAAEGFIRQIIGWREYVRGIYWREGPDYGDRNFLNATRDLPAFYWTGETDMHCLAQSIGQTLDHGYAHHIQRLMITGNFALLIGADPAQVHRWYLEIYADAYEWVELPNTLGMSQFGDGGLLASKPYASSGSYIDRMSDYCEACRYDVKQRTGADACPFNALYWDFLARNQDRLGDNRRLAMPYRSWEKMDADVKRSLRASARAFLDRLDAGGEPT
ncbi:cryptochrome/photolyase family protein [Stakelama pacifica]|uniref:Deoxyribodipyrimidine photolyase-related protein n=1 Tax=Stakelama pacifica TaxID=517720 RepID=A0A4R6FWS3_9SPHN|nr:cryptochrome/photolyase family protein [Stakelama pacifica]TDN85484.1 deoxyribodipyrimidine photolyase-related protein [Stakelama pacifica]GGO92516.1 (6-4) photolyase [Stakelama pacifica]